MPTTHDMHAMHKNSLDTYRLIGYAGITQENERRVYAYLIRHPFSTVNEIMRGLGEVDRNRVGPRVSNLKSCHWVREWEQKRDPFTECPGARYTVLSQPEHDEAVANAKPTAPASPWRLFEAGKRYLKTQGLATDEYERRIAALADALGL